MKKGIGSNQQAEQRFSGVGTESKHESPLNFQSHSGNSVALRGGKRP